MRLTLLSLPVALLVLPCLAAPAAFAETSKPAAAPTRAEVDAEKALALQTRGAELLDKGQNEAALVELRASWALKKNPETAALLGACELKLGQFRAAAEHLYIGLAAREDPKERAPLEALFNQATAKVGRLEITVNVDGATVIVGKLVKETPLQGDLFIEPGEVTVLAKKTGLGETRTTFKIEAGKALRLDLHLPDKNASSSQSGQSRSLVPTFVLGGLGLAAAGAAVGLFVVGADKRTQADQMLADLKADPKTVDPAAPCRVGSAAAGCEALKSARQDSDTLTNAGTGLAVGAGVMLAAGVVYGLLARSSRSGSGMGRLTVGPVASPSGGGLWMSGQF